MKPSRVIKEEASLARTADRISITGKVGIVMLNHSRSPSCGMWYRMGISSVRQENTLARLNHCLLAHFSPVVITLKPSSRKGKRALIKKTRFACKKRQFIPWSHHSCALKRSLSFQNNRLLLYATCRGCNAMPSRGASTPPAAAAVAAGEEGDDDVDNGDDAVYNSRQDAADAVDHGHDAGPDRAEQALDLCGGGMLA